VSQLVLNRDEIDSIPALMAVVTRRSADSRAIG